MQSRVYACICWASFRPSDCLPHPNTTAVGLLLWAQQPGDISQLLHCRRSCTEAKAGSVTLSADVGSWRQTCYCSSLMLNKSIDVCWRWNTWRSSWRRVSHFCLATLSHELSSTRLSFLLVRRRVLLLVHFYASMVFAVIVCPSVYLSLHLSITNWYCIETTGWIELVFGIEASFDLSHTVPGFQRKVC